MILYHVVLRIIILKNQMNYNYIIKHLFFLEPKCYWNQLTKFEIDRTILACLLCTDQPLFIEKHSLQKVFK